MCNANLLLTVLVVVSSIILKVHFNICILPKYIFDGSWGSGAEEAAGRSE